MTAAIITVYVPDDKELPTYLALFTGAGFVETDWCELTREGSEVVVAYGPSPQRSRTDERS